MKQIMYFVHGESIYTFPHYMTLAQLPSELSALEKLAREAMYKAGASHAVYAVKKYTEDGEVNRVDFYNPPVCLDDEEFYKRTDAEVKKNPNCLIYAVHRR